MKLKRISALALAGALTVSAFAGCGINKNATFATMGDTKITLGIANFLARYNQATMDDALEMYGYTWSDDLSGYGTDMEDSVKDEVEDFLHDAYTLKAHMDEYDVALTDEDEQEITEAAKDFMESNDKKALKEMGATQEIVEEALTLYKIQALMKEAIYAEVDTTVTDEEANMRGYSVVEFDTTTYDTSTGETVALSDEEIAAAQENAQAFLVAVKTGDTDFDEEATAEGYTASDETYDADDSSMDATLKESLDAIQAGDPAILVTGESAIYVAKVTTETDEEATESNRESIISTRKSDHYDSLLVTWQSDDGWTVNEDNWAKVTFDDYFTLSSETETETDITEVETTETQTESTETESAETQTTETAQ